MIQTTQNTLYVLTQGAYVHKDHQTVRVECEGQTRLRVPLHNVESVTLFGRVMVSPELLHACAESGIPLTFLSASGRLLSRVDSPVSGNVFLRREQYRWADRADRCAGIARRIVAGKLHNARNLVLRAARDDAGPDDAAALKEVGRTLAQHIRALRACDDLDEIRGHEGMAARAYFDRFNAMIRQNRDFFVLRGRTRRPPRDPVNCALSFAYALLRNDCVSAATAAGLDPNVGFLHTDRPGRPSLALDLMEEFRPLLADRLVLTLVNRQQLSPKDFEQRDGGVVELTETGRRSMIAGWQERKRDELLHPLLNERTTVGLLAHVQARLLARHIRGDLEEYVPCVLR
jgi:CRISPR-associated protein Cas1